jgi:hypothetical protein
MSILTCTNLHWKAVKRILHYAKGTKSLGLRIEKSQSMMISGFEDADWAGCANDRSIGGFAIFLGCNLVS